MTRRPYAPIPGTIPDKAIAHLRTLPEGTELTTAVFCEAIGFDPTMNLASYLRAAVDAGALKTQKKNGERWLWWSLGGGVAPAKVDDEDEGDEDKPLRVVPKPSGPGVSSVFDIGRGVDMDAVHHRHDNVVEMERTSPVASAPAALGWKHANGGPVAGPLLTAEPDVREQVHRTTVDAPAAMPTSTVPKTNNAPAPGIRVALWDDGVLQVLRNGTEASSPYTKAEARAIVDYLNAIDLAVLEDEPA